MYQDLIVAQTRLADLVRERQQLTRQSLPASFSLGRQIRQGTGEALIALGNRIKPGLRQNTSGLRVAGLGGR